MKEKKTFIQMVEAADPLAQQIVYNYIRKIITYEEFMDAVLEYMDAVNKDVPDYDNDYDRAMKGI